MPTFMFFGRLENERALCMVVRTFPWFNRGDYTPTQIAKLHAVGRELLAENDSYRTCTHVTVDELQGVTNTEIKGATVCRKQSPSS